MRSRRGYMNLDFRQAVQNMGEEEFDEFLDVYVNSLLTKEEKSVLFEKVGVEKMVAIINKIEELSENEQRKQNGEYEWETISRFIENIKKLVLNWFLYYI